MTGPEFLVGGFGSNARFPALYRVRVQENDVVRQFVNGAGGIAWGGQANGVERIIRGYDGKLRRAIEERIDDFDFDQHRLDINYPNLPLQEAVNMVSSLVLMQAGMSRFGDGIATVGGRIHFAAVSKKDGIKLLNEPELKHKFTGFFDET